METLRRARIAGGAAFFTQGLVFISLTTRLPDVRDRWDFGEVALSLILLMMVVLAGVGSVVAERAARSTESALVLHSGLLMMAVAIPVLVLAPGFPVFVAGMAAYGIALGVVDATTNMQAVAVEHGYGRPILPSFHGMWTLGGIIGSVITLSTSSLSYEWAAVVMVVPLAVASSPFLRRDVSAASAADVEPVPWRPLLLIGAALVLFYMVDTAAATWGPTYLDDTFDTPSGLVALATLPYLVASGAMRLSGDWLVGRFGPVTVLRVGAVVAFGALVVIVLAPTWPIAVLGFTILGLGVAVIAPLSYSAAAVVAGGSTLTGAARQARVDAVIARFNQFNYVGALLGSVLTGLAGAGSLRVGFAVPMVLVLLLLPLARAFAPASGQSGISTQ